MSPHPRAAPLWAVPLLFILAACDQSASVPPPVEQATADCAAPTYATDMLVCGDPELRALDTELASLWAGIAADPRTGAQDRAAQAAWFRERSQCAFEADHAACAEAAYRARIAVLAAAP